MDHLELRAEPASFPTGTTLQLVPYVNGISLLAHRTAPRRTKAGPHRLPADATSLAEDGHAGLALFEGRDLSPLRPGADPETTAVLGCGCGDTYCYPVLATISGADGAVTWDVAGMVLTFDARQYEQALRAAERAARPGARDAPRR